MKLVTRVEHIVLASLRQFLLDWKAGGWQKERQAAYTTGTGGLCRKSHEAHCPLTQCFYWSWASVKEAIAVPAKGNLAQGNVSSR